jgi:phosphoribosylformylglycinamidine synthase
MYVVGETTGNNQFVFEQKDGERPIDLPLEYLIGKPPRTVITDVTIKETYEDVIYDQALLDEYLEAVLQLEAVACKDWLTNKVDRSVTGKVARQQCVGEIQLPLADLGVVALDYRGQAGIATAIGHAPQAALADPAAGSVLAIAESLTNIVWAPLKDQINSISLSANWMWPCKNPGEDARLYKAVEAASRFAIALGVNIPTGKDSLSMTQKYGSDKVYAPGTVIISAGAEVSDVKRVLTPVLVNNPSYPLYHVDFSFDALKLGGSAFAQSLNKIGDEVPTVTNPDYFREAFNAIQHFINENWIVAGHDISAGGLITALLEMCFSNVEGGLEINLSDVAETDLVKLLFAENPGVLIQAREPKKVEKYLNDNGIGFARIGVPAEERQILIEKDGAQYLFGIDHLRDVWYESSYLLERRQSTAACAKARFENYKRQPLEFVYNASFNGKFSKYGISPDRPARTGVKAAIIREKGVNGDREMAYSLWLAGFDVKDVHMTDLMVGRETLEDVNLIVFVGGFSNSDVLGSAKGWAGGFLYNETARKALDAYYARKDTLSLGICNGCQCMVELGLTNPDHTKKPMMLHNDSHKFESEFITVMIPENDSVMFRTLAGSKLGVWVAHGEGKFSLPYSEEAYHIVAKYNHAAYPANPNGSDYATAGICSADGRHLAMMPHPERAIFPWQCAAYPADRRNSDQVTPWMEAFVNAREWVKAQR